jgi:hypothetical protein
VTATASRRKPTWSYPHEIRRPLLSWNKMESTSAIHVCLTPEEPKVGWLCRLFKVS